MNLYLPDEQKVSGFFDEMGLEEREAIARAYLKCTDKCSLERLDWMYTNWIGIKTDVKKRIYPHIRKAIKEKREKETGLHVRLLVHGKEPDV